MEAPTIRTTRNWLLEFPSEDYSTMHRWIHEQQFLLRYGLLGHGTAEGSAKCFLAMQTTCTESALRRKLPITSVVELQKSSSHILPSLKSTFKDWEEIGDAPRQGKRGNAVVQVQEIPPNPTLTCGVCQRPYATRTGLWKHQQKCSPKKSSTDPMVGVLVQLLMDQQQQIEQQRNIIRNISHQVSLP